MAAKNFPHGRNGEDSPRFQIFILVLLISTIAAPMAHAIGITPAKMSVNFEPELKTTLSQKVFNNDHRDLNAVIYAHGELEPYIRIIDSLVPVKAEEETKEFRYELSLPKDFKKPGLYSAEIVVMELPKAASPGQETSVTALGSVVSELYVRVPFPEKYAEAKLVVETTAIDKPVRFVILLNNYGMQNIVKAKAHLDILGATYEKLGEAETNDISLAAKQDGKIEAQWLNPDIKPGVYHVKGFLDYDGKRIELEQNFKVGSLSIEIIDLKADKFKLGSIAAIDVFLENKWNSPIKGVFGIMTATASDGTEYVKSKTTSIDMDAISRDKITAYWDTRDIPVGVYNLNIDIHYEGQTTTRLIRANVNIDSFRTDLSTVGRVVVGEATKNRDTFLYILILALIAANVGWFIYMKRRKK
ncbi:hypothetical protein HYV84_05465 [Candidatus Woesearchaeota archaeon]|nr:hypothetical protein [Candidatus Woesearchaeota archaeon]